MTRRAVLMGAAFTGLAIAPLVVSAQRLRAIEQKALAVQQSYDQLQHDAFEIVTLRHQQQTVNVAQKPAQDVIALVNSVLAQAGIPSNQLKSLVPESDSLIAQQLGSGASRFKRQTLRLTLENLSVQEFGSFLTHWQSSQQVWTVSRIELTHVRTQTQTNDHYDVTIILSAVYLA